MKVNFQIIKQANSHPVLFVINLRLVKDMIGKLVHFHRKICRIHQPSKKILMKDESIRDKLLLSDKVIPMNRRSPEYPVAIQ